MSSVRSEIAATPFRCEVVAFPLPRRTREIRETATAISRKRTIKSADEYRGKVAEALFAQLASIGLSETAQDEAVGAFFDAVDEEISTFPCRCHR